MSTNQRYSRQILLKEFGQLAQDKLSSAKILVVGVGGLGCPALQYLAAAGIGTLGIVDFDTVDISNLQRQILFSSQDIGRLKTEIAAQRIRTLNSEISVHEHNLKITNQNALEIIVNYDIVIDGTDNFVTKYLLNDACVILGKPYVFGAVFKFEGQLATFNYPTTDSRVKSNYRDLFPFAPKNAVELSCNEVGVLGVIPGIIGTMQAAEVIKLLTGIGRSLTNKMLCYNALENSLYEFDIIPKNPNSQHAPFDKASFHEFNYELFCNNSVRNAITVEALNELEIQEEIIFIDIRELDELPELKKIKIIKIPLSKLDSELNQIPTDKKIIFLCQSGIRSQIAVTKFMNFNPTAKAYSLEGGIDFWINQNELIQ
ncbi:MAG: molybdopterin-synthase adenylyltransferase MoeB [Saprospiraceae bacterium]